MNSGKPQGTAWYAGDRSMSTAAYRTHSGGGGNGKGVGRSHWGPRRCTGGSDRRESYPGGTGEGSGERPIGAASCFRQQMYRAQCYTPETVGDTVACSWEVSTGQWEVVSH